MSVGLRGFFSDPSSNFTVWFQTWFVGDCVEVSSHEGSFHESLLDDCRELIMFAAGTGFTPMAGLISAAFTSKFVADRWINFLPLAWFILLQLFLRHLTRVKLDNVLLSLEIRKTSSQSLSENVKNMFLLFPVGIFRPSVAKPGGPYGVMFVLSSCWRPPPPLSPPRPLRCVSVYLLWFVDGKRKALAIRFQISLQKCPSGVFQQDGTRYPVERSVGEIRGSSFQVGICAFFRPPLFEGDIFSFLWFIVALENMKLSNQAVLGNFSSPSKAKFWPSHHSKSNEQIFLWSWKLCVQSMPALRCS